MKINWEATAELEAFTVGVNRRGPFVDLDSVEEFTKADKRALYGDKLPAKERLIPDNIPDEKKAFYYLAAKDN